MNDNDMNDNDNLEQNKNIEWSLDDLYKSIDDPEINQDISESIIEAIDFEEKYKGKIHNCDSDTLYQAVKTYETIKENYDKITAYAYLMYSKNQTDPNIKKLYQDTIDKIRKSSRHILFFTLEVNSISDNKLDEMLGSHEQLSFYKHWFKETRKFRPHQLPETIEIVLHEKDATSNLAWVKLYDEIRAKMLFDFEGTKTNISIIWNIVNFDPNEERRKKASNSIHHHTVEKIDIFSTIFNTIVKDHLTNNSFRKFANPISSRNLANSIEDSIVQKLIDTVKHNYKNTTHRYYKLKTKWLNKPKLNHWDRNAPLPGAQNKKFSWEEARSIVSKSYHSFSPKLGEICDMFFENNWIDAKITPGKTSGAFCLPTTSKLHPYMLMNFTGDTARDVKVLAHELGHCIHNMLSKHHGSLMSHAPLTFCETASVFGERLVFEELLKQEQDPSVKATVIANHVEETLNCIIKQIAFCDFEMKIHQRRKNTELSTMEMSEIWLQTQADCVGPHMILDLSYQYQWSLVPHFIHYPFYVYSYSFGECLVNSLYAHYQEYPDGFVDKYTELLSKGGSLHHKELLQPFGIDISEADFWSKGLNMISDLIDELEVLQDKLVLQQ